uniref:Non-specific serine/threonine protein kinase n=1 Tax=Ditylenchus dipsaci TaxID=166011 RepID=A0A915DA10_9BILA
MRAIFMIPTKPHPHLKVLGMERTSAENLLQHEFIVTAKGPRIIREMIGNAQDVAAHYLLNDAQYLHEALEVNTVNTLITKDPATLNNFGKPNTASGTMLNYNFDEGTLIQHTMENQHKAPSSSINQTAREGSFERTVESNNSVMARKTLPNGLNSSNMSSIPPPPSYENVQQQIQQQRQLASGMQALKLNESALESSSSQFEAGAVGGVDTFSSTWSYDNSIDSAFHKALNDQSDYTFLRNLTTEELFIKKESLEKEMDAELRALQARYHAKRQAILDAISHKKNGTVQF